MHVPYEAVKSTRAGHGLSVRGKETQQEAQGHEAARGKDAGFQAWFVRPRVPALNWKAVMS